MLPDAPTLTVFLAAAPAHAKLTRPRRRRRVMIAAEAPPRGRTSVGVRINSSKS